MEATDILSKKSKKQLRFTDHEECELNQSFVNTRSELKMNQFCHAQYIFYTLSWNPKHFTGQAKYEDTRKLIKTVLKKECPDIVAFQEPCWKPNQMIRKHIKVKDFIRGEDRMYSYIGNGIEAGFLYNKSKLSAELCHWKPFENPSKTETKINDLFKMRTSIVQFRALEKNSDVQTPLIFYFFSYHGPSNGANDSKKITLATQYLNQIRELQDSITIPIFVAGDFNVSKDKIKSDDTPNVVFAEIADDKREDDPIDFLVSFLSDQTDWKGDFRNVICRCYEKKEKFRGITNHFPITSDLIFSYAPLLREKKHNSMSTAPPNWHFVSLIPI